jgi:hypothetical protein
MVFKRLVKEFWFPFVAAIIWCVYNLTGQYATPWTVSTTIKLFGSAFFLLAGFSLSIFVLVSRPRVRKTFN